MADLRNTDEIKKILQNVAQVVRTTYTLFTQIIQDPARQPAPQRLGRLSPTLDYLAEVHEGFQLSQRASAHSDPAVLAHLGSQGLLEQQWVEHLDFSVLPNDEVKSLETQLIVYQQAVMALSTLPHLPPEAITFPQLRPSYADISVPASPAQKLARFEEIEHVIYRAGLVPLDHIAFAPLRRTYAFFEASVWLVDQFPPTILEA